VASVLAPRSAAGDKTLLAHHPPRYLQTMLRVSPALLALPLLSACPGDLARATTATTSTGEPTTTSTTTTSTTTPTTTPTTASEPCIPGKIEPCLCPGGSTGAQLCGPDGAGFEPCLCPDATTGTTDATTHGPTTLEPTTTTALTLTSTTDTTATTDTTDTTSDATGTTGTTGILPAGPCQGIVTFELTPAEAALSGDWQLTMSNLGEGQVASLVSPTRKHAGAVHYTPQIPCDATWYIWARVLNQASNDAYEATLDDMPDPPAIFEGDCSNAGNSYKWARLNWRDPLAEPCKYLQNPWAPLWTAGPHSVTFSYHESPALGRILLTTDPNLVPK